MKRLLRLLLLLSLVLCDPAMALDPATPDAPAPAMKPVQAINLRQLSLALLFASGKDDFKVCLDEPKFTSFLRRGINQDLEVFGSDDARTILGDTKAFSAEDKAAAARLRGFIPPASGRSEDESFSLEQAFMEALKESFGDAPDSERREALRRESADLRSRLNAGQLKAMPEDLRAACYGASALALNKNRGPLIEMYRSYIKELTLQYTAYRSAEGYLAARWGMTPAEVAKSEGLSLAGLNSGKRVYIDGSPAKAVYQFTDGRLSEVIVTFVPGCKALVCLNRYRTVNGLLVEKYGAGEDRTSTDDQALAETSSMLFEGMGRERYPWMLIEEGYRKEEHGWQTGESLVVHELFSRKKPFQKGSMELVHTVRYQSRKFLPRAQYLRRQKEEVDKKKRLQNL